MAYTMLSDPNVDDTKQVEAHLLAAVEVFTKDEDPRVHAHILQVLDVARQRLKGSSDKYEDTLHVYLGRRIRSKDSYERVPHARKRARARIDTMSLTSMLSQLYSVANSRP